MGRSVPWNTWEEWSEVGVLLAGSQVGTAGYGTLWQQRQAGLDKVGVHGLMDEAPAAMPPAVHAFAGNVSRTCDVCMVRMWCVHPAGCGMALPWQGAVSS